jgi:hypothetical protein
MVDASVAETRYALDHLGAASVCPLTSHRGMYLGDQRLEPIYAEVAARNSVVFVHPTSPLQPTRGATVSSPRLYGGTLPAPVLEFMFETTRSITDLVLAGVLRRHPQLRIIVPHAGAVLPVLASRIDLFAAALARDAADVPSLREALKSCTSTWPAPRCKNSWPRCFRWPIRHGCTTAAIFRSRRGRHANTSRSNCRPPGSSTTPPWMQSFGTTPWTC